MRDPNDAENVVGPDGIIRRQFSWKFTPADPASRGGQRRFSLALAIEVAEVEAWHRAVPRRPDVHVWGTLASAEAGLIDSLADRLLQQHAGLTPRDQADSVLAFVQQTMYYQPDPLSVSCRHQLVRCPVETLVDLGGDCEDLAILAAALLLRLRLRFTVALLFLPPTDGIGHCAVGVWDLPGLGGEALVHDKPSERFYEYGETTHPGYRFGQAPPGYHIASAAPVVLLPHAHRR